MSIQDQSDGKDKQSGVDSVIEDANYREKSDEVKNQSLYKKICNDERFRKVFAPLAVWSCALWLKLKPIVSCLWLRFHAVVEKLFALADHSSIRSPRVILRLTIALLVSLFMWASFFHIDQVIHAQGQVIASSRTQIIQAADGGILSEMRVEEGDTVTQGQIIAVLEKGRALAAYTESFGKVTALRLNVTRLRAEIAEKDLNFSDEIKNSYPDLVETQTNLFKQRRQGFLDQTKVLSDNVRLADSELKMNIPLERNGDISKVDLLRLQRAANEARGNLIAQRNKYFQDASAELNKAEEDLNAQEQSLRDRAELLEHTDIISPAAGIVKNVKVTTLGGVIRQGDEILQILPTESDLVVEAKVKPADMAAMRSGLTAKVKLDAYDYSIFGAMKGVVSYVSPDTLIEDTKAGPLTYYRVKVIIGESEIKGKAAGDIEVRPGMTATIDIKTGGRSVLSFLMKPITKTLHDSMGER
jgi:adhesin transport system membrane fusion protein